MEGPPYRVPVCKFHSHEFYMRDASDPNRSAPYYRWNPKKAQQFIEDLANVIARRHLTPICCAVNVRAFNALAYGERCFFTGAELDFVSGKWKMQGSPSRPYRQVFLFLLREATNLAEEGTRVHFLFDQQEKEQPGAQQQFDYLVRTGGGKAIDTRKLGQRGWGDRRKDIELQSADLLVDGWRAWLEKEATGKPLGKEREIAMNLITTRNRIIDVREAEHLERLLQRIAPEDRELLQAAGPHGLPPEMRKRISPILADASLREDL